ncbi:hypothetical protein RA307_30850 [Xanthobacteraceae bacterium Astr-EGSB]|uniref:hypothetical protein n=1 Tax=Astrobacterium formosum TaxID=3069710 RepID=UPI0027B455E2|nr:hypothetical protein [Xanthobacteraceae bacterium Astr-EGSB]
MTKHARDLFGYANLDDDRLVPRKGQGGSKNDQMAAFDDQMRELCAELWPGRGVAPVQLAAVCGFKDVREAQRILAGQRGFSLRVMRRLCHSLHGKKFLALFMDGCTASYWLTMLDDHEVGEIERRSEELHREAEELKRRRSAPGRGGRS